MEKVLFFRVQDLLRNKNFDKNLFLSHYINVSQLAWPDPFPQILIWRKDQVESHLKTFPDGSYIAVLRKKIIGTLTSQLVSEQQMGGVKSWAVSTDNGYLTKSHTSKGIYAFGVDLSVIPDAPRGVGTNLATIGIIDCVIAKNLRGVIMAARIPHYHRYQDRFSVEEYLALQIDPELKFYFNLGFESVKIIPNYLDDPQSSNFGILMKWDNPIYLGKYSKIVTTPTRIFSRLKFTNAKKFLLNPEP